MQQKNFDVFPYEFGEIPLIFKCYTSLFDLFSPSAMRMTPASNRGASTQCQATSVWSVQGATRAPMRMHWPGISIGNQGRIHGGRGPWGQDPPPPFWGTPKLQKEGETSRTCARMQHVLVLKQLAGPPPSFPKSCIRPWVTCKQLRQYLHDPVSKEIYFYTGSYTKKVNRDSMLSNTVMLL